MSEGLPYRRSLHRRITLLLQLILLVGAATAGWQRNWLTATSVLLGFSYGYLRISGSAVAA